jgi:hypothetical protein
VTQQAVIDEIRGLRDRTARMTATREALRIGDRDTDAWHAALAEVEEWEADRVKTEGFVNDWGAESLANLRRAEAAEAERDRLREALEKISSQLDEPRFDHPTPVREAKNVARAALRKQT